MVQIFDNYDAEKTVEPQTELQIKNNITAMCRLLADDKLDAVADLAAELGWDMEYKEAFNQYGELLNMKYVHVKDAKTGKRILIYQLIY